MIERPWRSLKYECIYLNAFETGSETRAGIKKWIAYYNAERPHSTHEILTPNEAYDRKIEPVLFNPLHILMGSDGVFQDTHDGLRKLHCVSYCW